MIDNYLSIQRFQNSGVLIELKRVLLLLILSICFINRGYSSSYPALDNTYRHLKNLEYEVTIVIYRDCRAIPANTPSLVIYNDSFKIMTTVTRVKIEDIAYFCKSKPCNPPNTTVGSEGIEAHYFMDTIDFNSGVFKKFVSKKYCNVYFGGSIYGRNGAITTMSQGPIFAESMLNLCLAAKSPVNSPRFINPITTYAHCNLTFSYSFYANNYFTGDSVSYELVKAMNDVNSYETYKGVYTEKIPLTPYCTPPGSYNCTPTTSIPVRGTSFNSSNGNFLITPINCTEIGVVVCQVNLFRKDSGKYKLVSYCKRDMMLIIISGGTNKPTLTNYKDYTLKARENFCIDIKVKDDTTKTIKDTVNLVVREFPKYGTLSLLDSNAREKTMHYCWNATDADYMSKKEANIAIYAYDKPCNLRQTMSTVINFKVVAPDSFTDITIQTYYDINKNGKKDIGEPFRSAPVLSEIGGSQNHLITDNTGSYNMKPFFGTFRFNIDRSQFLFTTSSDTVLNSKFDSSHTVLLGFNYQQGLKGKVYEDNNNNCVFDAGDAPVRGLKVFSKNTNTIAITDIKGEYLLNGFTGQHVLIMDSNSIYTSSCTPSHKATIVNDSQFSGFDFPLQKKTGFSDISVILNPARHIRDGSQMTQNIVIENRGNVNVKNFYIQLLTSKKLFQFSSIQSSSISGDTIVWYIDSIVKGAKRTLDMKHTLMPGSYKNGDLITYQLWATNKDKVMPNNYYELTETVDSQNCCATAKTVYAPDELYPLQPTLTYRLYFKPSVNSKRALISDMIDTNRFDLHSLRILTNNVSLNTYVKGNVLYGDLVTGNFLSNAELIYTIALKTPLTDSFTVRNTGACDLDYQTKTTITNTVATKVVSPIVFDPLTKTTYCAGEVMSLGFNTNYKPDANNRFRVFLSDSSGKFGQPSLLLDTASKSVTNSLRVKIPSVYNSHTYKIKVIGSSPALEAFASQGNPAITIHPLPAIQYTTNLNNGKICIGDSIRITAKGASKYSFIKFGNAQPPFGTDSVRTDVMRTNATYLVVFQSSKGCNNTSPLIIAGLHPLPVVLLSPANSVLCEGEKVSLSFSGANIYNLYRNTTINVLSGLSSSPALITPPAGNATYTMTGTDMNGCKDTSNQILVKVNPLPAKPVIIRVQKSIVSNYAYGNQWYNLNGRIDTAVNSSFYPQKDGSYFVRHTDSNGCENTSDLFVVNFTSLNTISDNAGLFIYPNPVNDLLTIANPDNRTYHYSLYDAFGEKILEGTSAQAWEKLDVSSFSSGHYVLNIITSAGTGNLKFTILH